MGPQEVEKKVDEGMKELDGDAESFMGHVRDHEAEILASLGYKQELKREFSNISTISFALSIMSVSSSSASTLNTPLLDGGPASATWCWFIGWVFCTAIGASIAEIVSAYPTSGGMYSATSFLTPRKYRQSVAYAMGWLNLLGQTAGVSSTNMGAAQMITAAIELTNGYVASAGVTVAIHIGLLVLAGILCSLDTKMLAQISKSFMFFNLGSLIAIVIALPVLCKDIHWGSYIFTHVENQTGWSSTGLSFLFGLLNPAFTFTDYDATAHISEEVQKASVLAPMAIFLAVTTTGFFGWIYIMIYVLCSGPLGELANATNVAATIIQRNLGNKGFCAVWSFVIITACSCVLGALVATGRTAYAFSRDNGLPDNRFFTRVAKNGNPVFAIWLIVLLAILLGLLLLASPVASGAVFSLTAIGLDASYAVGIFCKMFWGNHPDVQFKPGPFYMGKWSFTVNMIALLYIVFVCVILAIPETPHVTADTMNYSSVLLGGVLVLSLAWYLIYGRRVYESPGMHRSLPYEEERNSSDVSDKNLANVRVGSSDDKDTGDTRGSTESN